MVDAMLKASEQIKVEYRARLKMEREKAKKERGLPCIQDIEQLLACIQFLCTE